MKLKPWTHQHAWRGQTLPSRGNQTCHQGAKGIRTISADALLNKLIIKSNALHRLPSATATPATLLASQKLAMHPHRR